MKNTDYGLGMDFIRIKDILNNVDYQNGEKVKLISDELSHITIVNIKSEEIKQIINKLKARDYDSNHDFLIDLGKVIDYIY